MRTMQPTMTNQPKKRTRVLAVRQSSRGCLTCKRRRIKCDETTPECLRCQRSQRFCAGHAYCGFEPHSPPAARNDRYALGSPPAKLSVSDQTPAARHLTQLACSILTSNNHSQFGPAESLFFAKLLPLYSETMPYVAAAAAAFGAAYSAGASQDEDAIAGSEAQYSQALRLVQHELASPVLQFIPFFMSSFLLASAEVISGRQRNAVVHLLSVFAIFFPKGKSGQSKKGTSRLQSAVNEIQSVGGPPDSLDFVLMSLDTQMALFAWAKPPVLPSRFDGSNHSIDTIDDLIAEQHIILHASMHFMGKMLQENYGSGLFDASTGRLIEQGQLIAALRQWIVRREELLLENTERSKFPPDGFRHLEVLKAQCHCTLIVISTLPLRSQMAYDTYLPEFQQIIACAEKILGPAPLADPSPSKQDVSSFCPHPGLIQPLSLTARKCRNPLLRRKAICLLQQTGKEGPLVGAFEAALGRRICEIEEDRPFSFVLPAREASTTESQLIISDDARVRACWRVSLTLPDRFRPFVRFARHAPPPEPALLRPVGGTDDFTIDNDSNEECMEVWTERIVELGAHKQKVTEPLGECVDPRAWRLLPYELL